MKRLKYIVFVMLLALIFTGCANEALEETAAPTETEAAVETAPDFTVLDGEGNEVKLSDFFGKPIVLNFWATWCGPCQSEMPEFNEAYLAQGDKVQFLMVNLTDGKQDTVESVKEFIEEAGYEFPVYYDVNYDGTVTYGVSSIPMTLFIDADGVIQAYANQAISGDLLQQGIDLITE